MTLLDVSRVGSLLFGALSGGLICLPHGSFYAIGGFIFGGGIGFVLFYVLASFTLFVGSQKRKTHSSPRFVLGEDWESIDFSKRAEENEMKFSEHLGGIVCVVVLSVLPLISSYLSKLIIKELMSFIL